MDEETDFSQPWAHSDIIFVLEGRKVHANRTILSMWSPVLNAMFNDDFREKTQDEIELPGKSYIDFVELMHVVHPPNKDIDGNNVCQLLPLTEEYQMAKVTDRCERYLLSQPASVKSLVLADTYNLGQLKKTCIQYAKNTLLSQLQIQPEYERIHPAILLEILSFKVERMESPMNRIKAVAMHTKPNTSKWCPAVDSRDTNNHHNLGAKKNCMQCNSYNFEQIERICTRIKLNI